MKSIHKIAYAAVLGLGMFTIQPSLAAAEDVRGNFSLVHEVRCKKILLRPGDYHFIIKSMGSSQLLTLQGLHGTGTDAMVIVDDIGMTKAKEESRLVLVLRDGQSFLSSMELPGYDLALRFAVPAGSASKAAPVETAAK